MTVVQQRGDLRDLSEAMLARSVQGIYANGIRLIARVYNNDASGLIAPGLALDLRQHGQGKRDQVAVKIDDEHAVAGFNVLADGVAKQPRFTKTGLAPDDNVLTADVVGNDQAGGRDLFFM